MTTTRDLSLFQLEVLLKQVEPTDRTKRSASHWLLKSDIQQLLLAVDHDAEEVYLPAMGRMFNVQYRDNRVWLSPTGDAFTPCGWFTVADLRREVALP